MTAQIFPATRARRLQWIAVAYFVAGVSLSGLFVSAATVWVAFEHLSTMQERALSSAVQGRRAVIEQYVARIRVTAAQIASRTRAREGLQAYNRGELGQAEFAAVTVHILEDAQSSAADVLGISRFDRHGRVAANVGVEFPHLLSGLSLDSGVEIREIALGGEMVLALKTVILDRSGQPQGTDVVVFSLDELRTLTQPASVVGVKTETILGVLHGETLTAIANGDVEHARPRDQDAALSSAILAASQGKAGRFLSERASVAPMVVAYAPVWGTDWGLVASVSREDLYVPVWREVGDLAWWLGLLLFCATVIAALLSRSLSGSVLVQAEEWLDWRKANQHSEQALEVRTNELEPSIETVDQGIAMLDGSLHVVAANRRYLELTDVPADLLKPGSDFVEIIRYNAERGEHGGRDADELVRERSAMWQRREYHEFERTRPVGTILRIEAQPVAGGGIVVTYTDITERCRTQERAAHIGRLLDESLNEIYIFDAVSLRFIDVNQGAQTNLGYTMAELCKLTPVDIKPNYSVEQFEAMLGPLRSGTKTRLTFSTLHQRKDGTDYPVEAHVQCSRSEGRDLFVAMSLDISERAAAAAAIRDSEARYQALYDDNPSMFFTIDACAVIVSVNQFGAGQLGYEPDELIGRPLSDLAADTNPVLERKHIKACLSSLGTVHREDVGKRHRDGANGLGTRKCAGSEECRWRYRHPAGLRRCRRDPGAFRTAQVPRCSRYVDGLAQPA